MKRMSIVLGTLALATLVAGAAFAGPGGDKAWFDLENCGMCKNLMAEEGLMDHMQWENHIIATGAMSVTKVDPKYDAAFQRAHANMEAAGKKMMAGEKMELCGFCTSYGSLAMAGAKMENLHSDMGYIGVVTSTDPAVIEKIHAHTKRTQKEFKKWMEAEGKGHSHDGHDHSHEGHGH